MSFPISPSNGQTAVLNGITYVYSSANTAWTRVAQGSTTTVSLLISGTATSTSTTTGALQVVGGAGVGGSLNVGGSITAPSIYVGPWAVSTGSSLANISPYSGIFTITNTTVSISTNTGALQVTGGVGVGGNINVGGNAAIINVPPVTQTYGGVLQVGTTLNFSDTNILSSFSENTNTYAQVILQNLNGGSSSSADFILNNNSTTGASIYGDFGINGTGYSGIDPFSDPSGTYLYGAGGTLSIGTPNAFNFKVATNNTVALTITPDQNARFVGIVTATNMFIGPWAVSTGTGVLSVANALTINNGGSGAASGSTFNGSSPVTISYNSIGAPSTGGVNATGTWNIVAGTALIANSVSNLLTINSAGVGGASPQTYNGGSALTISYNTIGAPSTGGTNATGTWNIVAGSAVTATYAAVAYSLASTSTVQVQFATSATTATSAAVAYRLANTSTTQVGYAATATSAAVAYSLANTSTTQVGYAVNATNLINTASTLVGYANYAYGFNTSTLVTNAVTALNASNINTVLQTASASYYPTFVNANNSSPAAGSLYTTSSFSINPATGLVSHSTSTISVNGWTLGINPSGVPTTSTTTATSYPTGFYAANLYSSSGYPSSYGYLQSMSSNYANSMAQTYFSWTGYGDQTGSAGQPAYMWVRTNRDSNNQFGAWQQVLLLQQNGDLSLGTAHSYGSGNMNMSGIFTSTNTTNASSTITGALQVAGGAGIGQNLYVGGSIYSGGTQLLPSVIQEFSATAGQTIFTTTNAYTVGSVQVYANGIALGNGDFTATNGTTITLNVARTLGDVIRVQSAAASVNAVTTSAVTVLGGTAGQLLYQSASGTTAFAGPGTAGQVLISQGTGAPLYQSTLTVTGSAVGIGTAATLGNLNIGTTPGLMFFTTFDATTNGIYSTNAAGSAYTDLNILASTLRISTAGAERMRVDSTGNVGIGTVPSTWGSGKVMQIGGSATLYGDASQALMTYNAYYNAGWKYTGTGNATEYAQLNGAHQWYTAPSGSAGGAISFTQAMTLDTSSNLLVGTTTSPSGSNNLSVAGNVYVSGNVVNPKLQGYTEVVTVQTATSAATIINLAASNIVNLTLNTSTTIGFINTASVNLADSIMIVAKQSATTGTNKITWPSSVKWPNGSAPALSTATNAIDVLNFITIDGGASFYGALSLGNLK